MKKQYKALMLDLDGTTIPNDPKGMPSQKVITAIHAASKKIHVGAITGRPYFFTKPLIQSLSLTGPSIFGGGSRIVDVKTNNVIWEAHISRSDVTMLHDMFISQNISFIADGPEGLIDTALDRHTSIYSVAAQKLSNEQAETILEKLKDSPTLNAHKIVGWDTGTFWVQITHVGASKHHGILKVAQLLGIETQDIIGVGDGYNDFPLLMACGLKIAMGNAVPELKKIADYIAPTVDDDGVVDIIERFVL